MSLATEAKIEQLTQQLINENNPYYIADDTSSQTPVNQMVIQDEPITKHNAATNHTIKYTSPQTPANQMVIQCEPITEYNPAINENINQNQNTDENDSPIRDENKSLIQDELYEDNNMAANNNDTQIQQNINIDNKYATYDMAVICNNGDIKNKMATKPIFHGHMLIYIPTPDKYYCTHCCAIMESRLLSDHLTECYFIAPTDKAHYCSICNIKNTPETASFHFNSAKHMLRYKYINELIKNTHIYVNAAGVSHTRGSKQQEDDGAYAIDTTYLVDRLIHTASMQTRYSLTRGEQLYKLIARMINDGETTCNRETAPDDVRYNLIRRKCLSFFKPEVISILMKRNRTNSIKRY